MRIATWNVDGLNARRDELLCWLRKNRPDVLGLQELKTNKARVLNRFRDDLRIEGYHTAVLSEPSKAGVAILSKQSLKVTQQGLPGREEFGARLLTVQTAGLSFTTVCVPIANKRMDRKLLWLDTLISYVHDRHTPDIPAILCGDFNVAPDRADDWERSERKPGTTSDERSRMRSLRESGWFDLVREWNPDARLFSWWWSRDFYCQDKGLRLDLVLGNQAIRDRLQSARIIHSPYEDRGRTKKPDHAPVIVDLV